ncbi:MAG TPA: ATP-dependent DNA helicase, partial [Ramlibacter sp.]|nr:ATP-dependent DNA helicase [Ramlibacter sp.]
ECRLGSTGVDWQGVAAVLERATRELRLAVGRASAAQRLRWVAAAPEQVDADAWREALSDLRQALEQVLEALDTVSELAPDFVRLHERAMAMAGRIDRFLAPCEPGCVRWVDVGLQLRLVESPLDIAEAVRGKLLKAQPVAAGAEEEPPWRDEGQEGEAPPPRRTWVFTSATLGDDQRLSWFTEPCGLDDAEVLRVGSPFDYPSQAALYLPRQLPKPSDPAHSPAVARLAAAGALRLGGRTMVLTTTLRALRTIGEELARALPDGCGIEVLVQGQWPKRRLIERFRAGTEAGAGCVLVASASFWEGVDVPGEALQLVLIDKLPFPPPGDPLVEARSQRLEAQGRNPFNDYFIPEAAVALKQGAGRLIRRESDRGVLVVCDTRLGTMGYGRRLLAALPAMRRLQSEEEFREALDDLREVSA